MQYIEAPENFEKVHNGPPLLFLAGGITGCPDWQKELARMLVYTNYVVLNPRRKYFSLGSSSAEQQIGWEFKHLRKADVIAFWFCKETIQPIALFELGAWSQQKDPAVFVGVEPGYPREQDIHIQMALLGRSVISSLKDLASHLQMIEYGVSIRLSNKASS